MSSTLETPLRYSSTIQSPRSPPNSRLGSIRAGVHGLFSGQSTVERARSHSVDTPESPKTPRPVFPRPVVGLQNLPSPRLHIPYLTRSRSQRSARSHHSNNSQSSITPLSPRVPEPSFISQPISPNSLRQHVAQSNISAVPPQARRNAGRRFDGLDPAELALAELAQDGRTRRRVKNRNASRRDNRICGPKIKNKKIRSKILSCFISGMVNFHCIPICNAYANISSFSL